jgi:hypothetical protein
MLPQFGNLAFAEPAQIAVALAVGIVVLIALWANERV